MSRSQDKPAAVRTDRNSETTWNPKNMGATTRLSVETRAVLGLILYA